MRVLLAACALALSAGVGHATTITTLDKDVSFVVADTSASRPDFGATTFGTFGQSVELQAGKVSSFGFMVNQTTNPVSPVDFNAYIYEWDDTTGLGAELFATGPLNTTNNSGVVLVNVNTDLILGAGRYALLFESLQGGPAEWGVTTCVGDASCPGGDAYADGNLLYSTSFSGSLSSQVAVASAQASISAVNDFWVSSNFDSAFVVQYEEPQVVPIAGALPFLASGLMGLGAIGWRRRKS